MNMVDRRASWPRTVWPAVAVILTILLAPVPTRCSDVGPLVSALTRERAEQRLQAVKDLGKMGPAAGEAVPALLLVVDDPVRAVGLEAAAALGKIAPGRADIVLFFLERLTDDREGMVETAARGLKSMGRFAVPALLSDLAEGAGPERQRAVWALEVLGPEAGEAVPDLIEALQDKEREVRIGAAVALGEIGPAASRAAPVLTRMMKHRDVDMRRGAAFGLKGIKPGDQGSINALVGALGDRDEWVRSYSTEALRDIGPPALPALTKTLAHPVMKVRYQAVFALGGMGEKAGAAAPALVRALESRDYWLPQYAAAALGRIGVQAVQPLLKALESENQLVRGNAAFALGEIGPPAAAAVPALTMLMTRDENEQVRQKAEDALRRIDLKRD